MDNSRNAGWKSITRLSAAAGAWWVLTICPGGESWAALVPSRGPGWRALPVEVSASDGPFLRRLAPDNTGLVFTNFLSDEGGEKNTVLYGGAGVAAGDVDGDGWCDLYLCSLESSNALFRNLGNGRFQNITADAGLAVPMRQSTGAVLADVDGDGDLDLLVNSLGHGTRLFLNDAQGHFTEKGDAGLDRRFGSTSMALADVDGDGDLDLYVCNYSTTKIEDRPNARFDAKVINGRHVLTAIDGVPMTAPELTNRYYVDSEKVVREMGEPDAFYLNEGRGTFRKVSWTDGAFLDDEGKPLATPPYDFGLSVMFRDINGDGRPDIYVCNDLFPPDRIWINQGRGKFRACSNLAIRNTSRFSMGVDFADINRDGIDDFFVVDMLSREHARRKVQTIGVLPIFLPPGRIDNRPQYKRNTLFLGRGDGTYAEISFLAGLSASEWSWMPLFLDVDLDGYEDVLITTGHPRDSLHADAVNLILANRRGRKLTDEEHRALKRHFYPVLKLPNQAYRNRGDLTFEEASRAWGFDYIGLSHGMCLADLDNDGDQDVIVTHINDNVGVYRNESNAPRVAVRLRGRPPNTSGVGARIRFLGGPVPQSQEIVAGGRYLSCDDATRTFACGRSARNMSLEVTWPSGARSSVTDVESNRLYEINEPMPDATVVMPAPLPRPFFSEVSRILQHTNTDDYYPEFDRQPLLTKRLGSFGPGVTWCDGNGDGWDDLVIGGGVGGTLALYFNDGKGGFQRAGGPPLQQMLIRDLTSVLPWPRTDGQFTLLAGSSAYEDALPGGSCVREFNLTRHVVEERLPTWEAGTGPLVLADFDADGVLDLFVGARLVQGRYPEPASSRIFRGNGTQFVPDPEASQALARVGLVSGAVASDLDGDGFPELVLACDWGPVKVFKNERGRFREATRDFGLESYVGWWNGVTAGDFDGDGRLDLLAANWGRNSKFQGFREQPLRIYFGEWRTAGVVDAMEAYSDPKLRQDVPWPPYDVVKAMPWFLEKFPTHAAYSTASVADVLGERMKITRSLAANWLETTVFFNRGGRFEARPLPLEAQLAPAFGVCVGDLDGDGTEDVFLSQNFFATDGDTPRYDAGRSLWLRGDGRGGFAPVRGQESGLLVYGEQRGCALGDYDRDGRVDLAVTQNSAETKLFHNERAAPGLRVRLRGTAGNPAGVGAVLRLIFGAKEDRLGPAREIHGGSGLWSHDSAVTVLATPDPPTKLWVRWPGGRETATTIPPGAREIEVDTTGKAGTVR
jgi:hypothetical protein